jgi:hypothetical protein
LNEARQLVNEIISGDDLDDSLIKNIASIDQFFIQALSVEMEMAEKQKNAEKTSKLKLLLAKIQDLSTPAELKVLDRLLEVVDDEEKFTMALGEIEGSLSDQLLSYMSSIIAQYDERIKESSQDDQKQLIEALTKINKVYQVVLKHSMKQKLNAE